MASKKNTKAVEKRVAERKAFVAARPQLSKAEARKRYYVSTRAQELEAAGKEVNRAALRKKFELGQIEREGFMTAQDIQRGAAARARIASSTAATLPGASSEQRPADVTRRSPSSMMDVRRKSAAGWQAGQVTPSSMKPKTNNLRTMSPLEFRRRDRSKDPTWYKVTGAPRQFLEKQFMDTLESAQATFIAPLWNPTVGRLDKRLKIREAGPVEGLINVAAVAASIPTGGAGGVAVKSLGGVVARGIARKIPGSRLVTKAARGLADEVRLLLPGTKGVKLPPAPPRTIPRPTPPGGRRSPGRPGAKPSAPKEQLALPGPTYGPPKPPRFELAQSRLAGAKNPQLPNNLAGAGSNLRADLRGLDTVKPGPAYPGTNRASAVKPVKAKTQKAPTKKSSAKKAPEAAAKKPVTREERVSTARKTVRERIDKEVKILEEASKKAATTKAPAKKAPTKKSSTKKKSSPKAAEPVAAPAKQPPRMVTSTGRSSTPAGPARKPVAQRVSPTTKFKSQADYDAFMARGGKEQLRGMTVQEQQQFTQTNAPWIIGRSRARTEAGRARIKRAERRKAVVDRYNQIMRERNKRLGIEP